MSNLYENYFQDPIHPINPIAMVETIKAHIGEIKVKTKEDEGAQFIILLNYQYDKKFCLFWNFIKILINPADK
jgi:hypothetical protein